MLDLLNYLLDSVTYFFEFTYKFITEGIYDLAVWAFTKIVEMSVLASLNFILWALPFAWDVAKNIIQDIGLSTILNNAWNSLDSTILGYATALRIPDSVNLIISAFFTKFVLRFIPFV
ncbi:MAG: DUF2523 family protein [Methylobacter sp.]